MDLPAQDFANIANGSMAVDYIEMERAALKSEVGHFVNFRTALKLGVGTDVDFKWLKLELAKKV